jgi:hypothetical protein
MPWRNGPSDQAFRKKKENTAMFTSAGLVTNTSATLFTFLLSRACPAASGPSFTISITAKKTAAMPMPYAGSVTAGSKSSTKCGSITPLTTPSSITAIKSNTAPGFFSFNLTNNLIFPLQTDRKSFRAWSMMDLFLILRLRR